MASFWDRWQNSKRRGFATFFARKIGGSLVIWDFLELEIVVSIFRPIYLHYSYK